MTTIRMFRNKNRDAMALLTFHDGIVEVVEERTFAQTRVKYLGPNARIFYVDNEELTPLTGPLFDASNWWVISHVITPTFYLNGAIQGITSAEHAARIANTITGDDGCTATRLSDLIS